MRPLNGGLSSLSGSNGVGDHGGPSVVQSGGGGQSGLPPSPPGHDRDPRTTSIQVLRMKAKEYEENINKRLMV